MLILSIQYIVKRFTFMPPKPPRYKIITNTLNNEEEIYFLIKPKNQELAYRKIHPSHLNIKYIKVYDNKNHKYIPSLIISPLIDLNLCIIYCQGNSGDLGTSLFECHEIANRCNATIVTFEYPGYGLCSEDRIEESNFYHRIKIIYMYVIKELNYKPERTFLYGFSLGTGIVFDFACKKNYPVAGVILQSPFLSILRTVYNIKKTKYFDFFNNCDKAKKLCAYTLFLHGNKDLTVPYIHGRILAKLIPDHYFYDFVTVDEAGHNTLLKNSKEVVFKYINIFISECLSTAKSENKIKFNNYLINVNSRKKNYKNNLSENANLNEKEESNEVQIFENKKDKANTLSHYKINSLYKNVNKKDSKKHSLKNKDTLNNQNQSMYNIESKSFKIEPKNKKISSNIYKPNVIKNSYKISNKNYFNKIGAKNGIKIKDKFGQIYKRNNKEIKENNKKKEDNKNNNNNNFEVYNSMISMNSSNTYINNNNK